MNTLRFLYLGDIMSYPGREVVKKLLPGLRQKHKADLVLAQAENISHIKGMTLSHMRELQNAGVDVFTGGNHTIERSVTVALVKDPTQPVLAPANQVNAEPAWGNKIFQSKKGPVQVVSLLGTIFSKHILVKQNPLLAADDALKSVSAADCVARIVNFHGDLSSEKRVIGYYLDGRVSAVIGDHWHVPTADAMVLPKGTAHITDVGMCGTVHSSLGVTTQKIIDRWRDGAKNYNEISEDGPYQLNAVLVIVDINTGLAKSIEPIRQTVEELR